LQSARKAVDDTSLRAPFAGRIGRTYVNNFNNVQAKQPIEAVTGSAVSRLRPVAMAAATTILGMAPLFPDAFFVSMAVTIAFGLGFATLLTMVVVPVLYATLFAVKS
jgi:multidrug efflux pump subunit AcrB